MKKAFIVLAAVAVVAVPYYRASGEVQIELFGDNPSYVSSSGGSFTFDVIVANTGSTAETFATWINICSLPDTLIYDYAGTQWGPKEMTLEPNDFRAFSLTNTVPGSAPDQWYMLQGLIGVFPWEVWDADTIGFHKSFLMSTGVSQPMAPEDWGGSWALLGEPAAGEVFSEAALPEEFVRLKVHPNPFNPATTLTYALSEAAQVNLTIYDIRGRAVANLVSSWREAGVHEVSWDATAVPTGVYFARLDANGERAVRKLLLLK